MQPTTGNSSGEFVIGQVFNSKSDLQEAAKIYSIKAHQEYVVVASSKKLLVLRCKKAEECHCPWKLRAMVVKDTSLFVINKYTGPHTCVNPCLNRDHHQLDSQLVSTHIKALLEPGPSSAKHISGSWSTTSPTYGCHKTYTLTIDVK